MKISGYLVVSSDGSMRVTKRKARLALNEVAFPLNVTIPDIWGQVNKTVIDLTMPNPPDAIVDIKGALMALASGDDDE